MKSSGITFRRTQTEKVLGIRIVMLLTIIISLISLQSCAANKDIEVKEIAPDFDGLLSGITISNPTKTSQDIALVSENILVTVSPNEYQFDGTYVLKSTSGNKDIKIGIPLLVASSKPRWEDSGRQINTPNLIVEVDGKVQKVKEEEVSRVERVAFLTLDSESGVKTKPQSIATPWKLWKHSFEGNREHTVKLSYKHRFDTRSKLGRVDKEIDPIRVYYIVSDEPWKNSAKATRKITFKLNKIPKDNLATFLTMPTRQDKDSIVYELKATDEDKFVGVAFRPHLKNKDVINALKAKIKKGKNKAWYTLRLGKEYDQRKMVKEKQELYYNYLIGLKPKLSEKLMSQPTEAVFEDIVEEFDNFKDKSKAKKLAKEMIPVLKKQIEINSKPVALTYKRAQKERNKNFNSWLEICQKTI